jgi:hypothetical protein
MFRLFRFRDRSGPSRKPRPKLPPKACTIRPTLEILEDRTAPAITTWTVTSLTDTNPGGQGVGMGTEGDLRYCINQANQSSASTNIINFGPNASDGTLLLSQQLPTLQTNVTINGPGASTVTIMRQPDAPNFSIFSVASGVTDIINGLTIENGNNTLGGGVYNQGTLYLLNDDLLANAASSGGGVYNAGAAWLYASDVVMDANYASTSGGACGMSVRSSCPTRVSTIIPRPSTEVATEAVTRTLRRC